MLAKCPYCDRQIPTDSRFCPYCEKKLDLPLIPIDPSSPSDDEKEKKMAQPLPTLPIEKRREILQRHIAGYVKAGYRVVSSTDTTAQLVRPKKFSCLWATLWTLVIFIGLLIYIFYYAAKKEDVVYLSVNEQGRVRVTKGRS